jgi:Putative Zn-dependent protease, contains TPR repeats
MKKIIFALALSVFGFAAFAQQDDPAKINQWIDTYNQLNTAKDWNGMLQQAGKCQTEVPSWQLLNYYKGIASFNLKAYDDAEAFLSIFIEQNKNNAEVDKTNMSGAYLLRADAYSQQKKTQEALSDYDEYLKLNPSDNQIALKKANVYYNSGDIDGYIAALSTAISADPQNKTLLENRANAYAKQQKWAEAVADYTTLIGIEPTNQVYYDSRAFASYSQNTAQGYTMAIADYNKIIELGGDKAKYLPYLTQLNAAIKDYKAEVDAWNQLVEMQPDNENNLYRRGLAKLNNKDYKGAVADMDKLIAKQPKNENAYKIRATAKTKLGDKKGAQEDAIKIMELEGKPVPKAGANTKTTTPAKKK